jgi:hypothetical protein
MRILWRHVEEGLAPAPGLQMGPPQWKMLTNISVGNAGDFATSASFPLPEKVRLNNCAMV